MSRPSGRIFFTTWSSAIQRISQVIEHAHEEDVVELPDNVLNFVHRALLELHLKIECAGGEACLLQIALVDIDSQHSLRAAPLHFDGIKTPVAADIEHLSARKILRNCLGQVLPLYVGKIS